MKIAIISLYCLDSTIPLAAHLGEEHEVDMYCLMNQSSKDLFVIDLTNVPIENGLHGKEATSKLVDAYLKRYLDNRITLMLYVFETFHPRKISFYLQAYELAKHIRKQRYDVIHIVGHDYRLTLLHLLLSDFPRVHTLHEAISHSGETPFTTKMMLRYLAKSKAHLIFPSEATSKRFVARYAAAKHKTHVIRFGLYEFYAYLPVDGVVEEANTILHFGLIRPYKGVEYLVEASRKAASVIPNLKVIIAGKNYSFDFSQIRSDKLFEIIDRTLTSEEIVSLVARASAVVCPYTSASQSGVIMTCYALNKPVIATRVDGLVEVMEEGRTGLLVPPRDADALADAIVAMLKDGNVRLSMKEEIKKKYRSGEYAWNNIAKMTAHVYNEAVGGRKNGV